MKPHEQTTESRERGYVLLEALFSVLILSVGLAAVIEAYKSAVRVVQFRQHVLAPAQALAENLMVRMELNATAAVPLEDLPLDGSNGRFQYHIEKSIWDAASNLQRVTVTISWTDRGTERSLALTTLLPGLDNGPRSP